MDNRFNFLGIGISIINFEKALEQITSYNFVGPNYICFPDASVISAASKDPKLTSILNSAFLTMPDGKPSQLAARLNGHKEVSTVSGYHLCTALLKTNLTHYFYGGDEETLEKMKTKVTGEYPEALILGYKAPPYLNLDDIESNTQVTGDIREINQLKPDLVWVGISSPKQDYLMHHHYRQLDNSLMLGVGGVFLYLADASLKSPEWLKKAGLRWLFRLAKEPARLWPKYYSTFKFLIVNSRYFINAYRGNSKPS